MAITDSNNEGYINKDEGKQTSSDRDYKGKINIEGKLYWLSGYKRSRGDGSTFLKIIATPVQITQDEAF